MSRVASLWRGWLIGVVVLWVAVFALRPEPEMPAPLIRPAERNYVRSYGIFNKRG